LKEVATLRQIVNAGGTRGQYPSCPHCRVVVE